MNIISRTIVLLIIISATVQTVTASIYLLDEDIEDYGYWIREIGAYPNKYIVVKTTIDLPYSTYGSITLENKLMNRMVSLQINKNQDGIGANRFGIYIINSTGGYYAYSGVFTNNNPIDPTYQYIEYRLREHRYLSVNINGIMVLEQFDTGLNARTELTQLKYATGWSGIGDMRILSEQTNLLLKPDGYRPFI